MYKKRNNNFPRSIVVRLPSVAQKRSFLSNRVPDMDKYKNVRFKQDLTKIQREESKLKLRSHHQNQNYSSRINHNQNQSYSNSNSNNSNSSAVKKSSKNN